MRKVEQSSILYLALLLSAIAAVQSTAMSHRFSLPEGRRFTAGASFEIAAIDQAGDPISP